jgi:hypothetical protein
MYLIHLRRKVQIILFIHSSQLTAHSLFNKYYKKHKEGSI